jgi:hypothetical protein
VKVPGLIQAMFVWLLMLLLMLVIGGLCQWLLFGHKVGSDLGFLVRWPILWFLYFLVAHSLAERITALIARGQRHENSGK